MKKLKKGLRLNEQNRKEITQAIVLERMGAELEDLTNHQSDVTTFVERALMDRLTEQQELEVVDLTTIPDGVMPTVKRHYLGDGYAHPDKLVDFSHEIPVPFCFYQQTNIDRWAFKFTPEQLEVLEAYAAKRYDVRTRETEMRQATMTFLNGFTSPQKLLDAAPDFEKYLPADMYGEEEAERVTLDDILNGGGRSEPEDESVEDTDAPQDDVDADEDEQRNVA